MLKVVEAFSGIGSQAKALKKIKADFEVIATVEWDINAVYAYDLIHNGPQDETLYLDLNKEELISELSKYTISFNGKVPLSIGSYKYMTEDLLRRFYRALKRTKNLVSITDVSGNDIPSGVDLLTYSFPCQDLSICGFWHGNMTGIDKQYKNRSNMLWEIERILLEMKAKGKDLPRFLLMENVTNIRAKMHEANFNEWTKMLKDLGYTNKVYTLNAKDFGIPQSRKRAFMISVKTDFDEELELMVKNYFEKNSLENKVHRPLKHLSRFLRTDYSNLQYKFEADYSNPNDTPSRQKILENNVLILDNQGNHAQFVGTITTKQDRNPNSGLIAYNSEKSGKTFYRNLTPRECFLLMGFEEEDYQVLMDFNVNFKKNTRIFTREKLIKLAGNSIVVNILEFIFNQIIELDSLIRLLNHED
jgi:DNA (cytosine-5)-methyltransferase 1